MSLILEYRVKATDNGFILYWGDQVYVARTPRDFSTVLKDVNEQIYQGTSKDKRNQRPVKKKKVNKRSLKK